MIVIIIFEESHHLFNSRANLKLVVMLLAHAISMKTNEDVLKITVQSQ